MKTALCKYTLAGSEMTLGVYFDLKSFDFITPPMSKDEEEDFIRLVCDSLAAAMPKESSGKYFYIKRVLKYSGNNTLKFLCTDGFLVDSALVVPISQQAFSKERIKISDIEQLPTRLKFSNELLKNINDRLTLFEDEAKKEFGQEKTVVAREAVKSERPTIAVHEYTPDKSFDVFAEIAHVKKEIRELVENSTKNLNTLMGQVDGVRKRIHDEVMKETVGGLQFEDNKTKLSEFAQNIISQAGGGDVEKNKEALTRKINEITPIYSKFVSDLEEISQRITKQTDTLSQLKHHVINALFESAKQYYDTLSKQIQAAPYHSKKTMLTDFNKKFAGIAAISESGALSSPADAQENLGKLSLDDLQNLISNDDKENPGLLQKCNTSWTEESPELQIVMKNIGQLNAILSGLFKDDTQFAQYANKDMIQITRIPFPRSFQFKFSTNAMSYKNAIEDFCKTQKESIANMSNQYKRTIQIDDVRDKTQRALKEIQNQTATMRKPVAEFRDLLKRKEASGTVIASANTDHEITEKYMATAKQLQDFISGKIDSSQKNLIKKISTLVKEMSSKVDNANKAMQELIAKKSRIDFTINNFVTKPNEKPNLAELDEKIKSMEINRRALIAENNLLQALNNRLAVYENLVNISDKISLSIAESDMRKQQNEAKGFLLQLIKNQSLDPSVAEQLKKQMVDLYTKVDTNVSDIEKSVGEIAAVRKQIFDDFNAKDDVPTAQLESRLQDIHEKLKMIESTKHIINEIISSLRKLSLESTLEKR